MNELHAPPAPLPYNHRLEEPVTTWQWIKTMLLMWVPLIGLVMMFYWAFSAHTNSSKRNYMRAHLFFQIPLLILLSGIYAAAASVFVREVHERNVRKASEAAPHHLAVEPQPQAAATMRMFKGTDGRTIEATVIGFPRPGHVQIRRADGQVFAVEVSKFSAEDIAYINQLRAATERP